ncbi:MAG: hypothetical protein NPIRA01_21000 [Nitrospirales bacterium]|nr:MAG: hypothetical protein NPIRA01_21000 [Nitrospirales bacterium]
MPPVGGLVGGVDVVTNVAVTDFAVLMVTTHEPDPVQAPFHLENVDPDFGVAARVTDCPSVKDELQELVQLIPAGALETDPLPEIETERLCSGFVDSTNFMVTDFAAFMVTTQEPDPEHAPPQLENFQFDFGVAERVTDCPSVKDELQELVQPIPAGALETVPLPEIETESLCKTFSACVLTSAEGELSFPASSYAVTAK